MTGWLFASFLGSARASRAGDGALAIANFSELPGTSRRAEIDCGEAPQSAREARALPRTKSPLFDLLIISCIIVFSGCESSNYVPPVTPQMVKSRQRDVDLATLERGRTLFANRCIECHTLPPLWHYTTNDWIEIVNTMSHRASLKPAERDAVVAYIFAVRSQR
jgi:hypothetical protein